MKIKHFYFLMMFSGVSVASIGGNSEAGSIPAELRGTTYNVSGINSRLVDRRRPVTVTFDGKPERVGNHIVNESVRSAGLGDAWVDFEFTRDYQSFLINPDLATILPFPQNTVDRRRERGMPLAGDPNGKWAVELTNLTFDNLTPQLTEFYMYFTRNGKAVDFETPNANSIVSHPFENDINVWGGKLRPLKPGELPPGASNGIVTTFDNYANDVHNSLQGLRVPEGVDGFHIGYRVAGLEVVPEPSTVVLAVFATLVAVVLPSTRRDDRLRVT